MALPALGTERTWAGSASTLWRNGDTASRNLSGPDQIGNNATLLITDGSELFLSGNNVTVGSIVLSNVSAGIPLSWLP